MALLCNDVSHWLGASLESALINYSRPNLRKLCKKKKPPKECISIFVCPLKICVNMYQVYMGLGGTVQHILFVFQAKTIWNSLIACRFWVLFNSLWPSDAIWHHRLWSELVQIMARCLMAQSHKLYQLDPYKYVSLKLYSQNAKLFINAKKWIWYIVYKVMTIFNQASFSFLNSLRPSGIYICVIIWCHHWYR